MNCIWQSREANQNFSRVTQLADEHGTTGILKNNISRYLVIDFSKEKKEKVAPTEDVTAYLTACSGRIWQSCEVLAK